MKKKRNTQKSKSPPLVRFNPLQFIGLFLVLTLCFGFYALARWVYTSSYFTIKKINSNFDIEETLVNQVAGESLFTIDLKRLYQYLQRKYPKYKNIQIQKIFPSTLMISVEKRIPFALVQEDTLFLIDKEGMILETGLDTPVSNMFIIEIDDIETPIKMGTFIKDTRLDAACQLIAELNNSSLIKDFPINTINASRLGNISFFINDMTVIVGQGSFKEKLSLLKQLFQSKYGNDLESLRYVDLRYATNIENIYVGTKR